MRPVSAFLLIALSAVAIKATNITGDPTNIANWPPCAQKCIPLGLVPPVSCNNLSNLTCICQNPAFTLAIADCERTSCSTEERQQITALSDPLCAPVGGLGASVSTAVSAYFATASPTASGLPTYPVGVTGSTAVIAIQATATPSPNLGNPANILTYPVCAQTCGNQSAPLAGCDVNNIECACGTNYRSITSACEEITCSPADRQTTNLLAQELCGPLYQTSPSLGSAVSSAIASATSQAASLASEDPTKIENYPDCAQKCLASYFPISGCGSLSNRTCVCKTGSSMDTLGKCEIATCSPSDIQIIADLANALCNPVGGIGNASANASYTAPASGPTPSTYTGDATARSSLGWSAMGLAGLLGWLLLL